MLAYVVPAGAAYSDLDRDRHSAPYTYRHTHSYTIAYCDTHCYVHTHTLADRNPYAATDHHTHYCHHHSLACPRTISAVGHD